ncbi:upf0496 protein at1g20180 [Phtheirospermum japonicum]|uniref:Upf0496 protein at1g20180 n=1 Tax=Phtheirospermum japonicum TaxID=374723 RepID=A0A830BH57_9LAMI|nr:upf0496 protein at1g20180 [Phtheirospermum japonicum]
MKQSQKSLNVNEEYLCAVRTKSYVDFFLKFQLIINEPSSSSSSSSSPANYSDLGFSEILLEPGQETITSILESSSIFSSARSSSSSDGLKSLLSNYFDISAEASNFCSHLLQTLTQLQSDYQFIQKIIAAIDDDNNNNDNFLFSELRSCVILNNPFSNLNRQNFKHIHDKHSSVLQRLKSNRKKVVRKMKMIKIFNRASGVCVTAACGLLAAAAVFLAVHTLTAILMGPAILSLPIKPLRKKIRNLRFWKCGSLRQIVEQLDVAAKGAYILNRDFDTMSRLVDRLGDEVEHNKNMIRLCLDRSEDKLSFQVLKEIKKYEFGFKKQVEELEEHVYLCLVTINRARAMVVKEISKDVVKES